MHCITILKYFDWFLSTIKKRLIEPTKNNWDFTLSIISDNFDKFCLNFDFVCVIFAYVIFC